MASTPLPAETRDLLPPPIESDLRLPADIRLGIALLLLGLVFMAVSFVSPFILMSLILPAGVNAYLQIDLTLSLIEVISLSLGLFLVLRGILRLLPPIALRSCLGPLLIFVGAVVFAVAYAGMVLAYSAYPPYENAGFYALYLASAIMSIAGEVLIVLGSILALIAVARGVLAQHRGSAPPTGP